MTWSRVRGVGALVMGAALFAGCSAMSPTTVAPLGPDDAQHLAAVPAPTTAAVSDSPADASAPAPLLPEEAETPPAAPAATGPPVESPAQPPAGATAAPGGAAAPAPAFPAASEGAAPAPQAAADPAGAAQPAQQPAPARQPAAAQPAEAGSQPAVVQSGGAQQPAAAPQQAAAVQPAAGDVQSVAAQPGAAPQPAVAPAAGSADPAAAEGQGAGSAGGAAAQSAAAAAPPPADPGDGMAELVDGKGTNDRLEVALTFDAGSDLGYTAQILDLLQKEGIAVTFGMTGSWAEQNPEMIRRMVAEGHQLMNHSYSHPSLTGANTGKPPMTIDEMADEYGRAEQVVRDLTGYEMKPYFRPPYGDYDADSLRAMNALGYRYSVMWTCDTHGWDGWSGEKIVGYCTTDVLPHEIVLMHLGSGAAGDYEALPGLIAFFRQQGYAFVTVEQMLQA